MGHRTKRIRERGDEKHRKTFIYKELRGLRLWGRHKTKRLHRLTFALRLGQIRLRPWDDRFTHRGLHVYACGLFCLWAVQSFVYGRLASVGFILRLRLNSVMMALEGCGSGKVRVPFTGSKMGGNGRKIEGWYSGGYSNWIFIFRKLDIQNSCPSIPCKGVGKSQKTE